jgi:RNA polymerase sigma factor (sigma-70 family)
MGDHQTLARLLLQWQESGQEPVLERLIRAAEPMASYVIERVLRRRGIRDPQAVDDALALVFDHLRRLPGAGEGERSVSPFTPAATAGDRGRAFLRQLAQDRALDVARARRRRARHVCTFSQLDELAVSRLEDGCIDTPAGSAAAAVGDEPSCRLHAALARLPPRDRQVIGLLLEGKNQAVIAHVIGVCEGTVSRIRRRAIDRLRTLLRY